MVFGTKDKVEEKKLVTRAATEGSGIYSCTQGECATNPFTTRDKEDFEKHGHELKRHYQQGGAPCAVCGQEVDMNVVVTKTGNKPLHPECRGEPEEL
jgi:alpha-D-ribose 1-methylphosphonate 5-phosphate C-P lyase